MIIALTLGGNNLLTNGILLQGFQNASFPATVYTRSKRGGYQGTKVITPSFASYQFVATFIIIGNSFSDLATKRDAFFQILGLVHSVGVQTLVATRADGTSRQLDIKAIEVTGDFSTDDGCSSTIQVTLNGEYPFLMSSNPKSLDVLLTNGGGFAVPFGVPLDMSAGASMTANITNAGNYPAFATFNFIGLLTTPVITLNTPTTQSLTLAQTLADSSHSAMVDGYNRTAVLQPSGNNARQYISGVFWTVPIGTTAVQLTSSNGGDTGKCTITWRDTFLNI
jgi:hypothetical protein